MDGAWETFWIKSQNGTSNEGLWLKNFKFHAGVPILAIFQNGLLVRPWTIPHSNWKNIYFNSKFKFKFSFPFSKMFQKVPKVSKSKQTNKFFNKLSSEDRVKHETNCNVVFLKKNIFILYNIHSIWMWALLNLHWLNVWQA